MKGYSILPLLFHFFLWQWPIATADPEYESCSKRTCDSDTTSRTNHTTLSSLSRSCSCSKSCTVYQDCCHDSPYRTTDLVSSRQKLCLSLKDKGKFQAIIDCPADWSHGQTWNWCTRHTGLAPPVTSRKTGATYSNIYCAICNSDSTNLQIWDVDTRCCPEHERGDLSKRTFIKKQNHLYSRINGLPDCPCHYIFAKNNTFLEGLELRPCFTDLEVSRCSPSWPTEYHRSQCRSFLDPVYSGDIIYRNKFCGLCNYIEESTMTCIPDIIRQKLDQKMSYDDIYKFCREKDIQVCVHYLESSGSRGKPQALNNVIRVSEVACVPPPGTARCCEGYRFDFKRKRCRQVTTPGSRRF